MTRTAVRTPLAALVHDLDDAVRSTAAGRPRVAAVGHALASHLEWPDLLRPDQRTGDPTRYRQHVLHVADHGAFSLVALVWLPGQSTAVHDHLSWCVVGVYEGQEYETRYRNEGGVLVVDGTGTAGPGTVSGLLPPGDIHAVTNAGTDLAISLHVYGVDVSRLGSSIRRRYDLPSVT